MRHSVATACARRPLPSLHRQQAAVEDLSGVAAHLPLTSIQFMMASTTASTLSTDLADTAPDSITCMLTVCSGAGASGHAAGTIGV